MSATVCSARVSRVRSVAWKSGSEAASLATIKRSLAQVGVCPATVSGSWPSSVSTGRNHAPSGSSVAAWPAPSAPRLAAMTEPQEIIHAVAEELHRVLGFSVCSVCRVSPDDQGRLALEPLVLLGDHASLGVRRGGDVRERARELELPRGEPGGVAREQHQGRLSRLRAAGGHQSGHGPPCRGAERLSETTRVSALDAKGSPRRSGRGQWVPSGVGVDHGRGPRTPVRAAGGYYTRSAAPERWPSG
jgi:hypothetical protein